jgi:metal transporter CNNM
MFTIAQAATMYNTFASGVCSCYHKYHTVSIWLTSAIVIILIGLSALCSGLNVALMSLDIDDLRRKTKLGNTKAKRAYYFRERTHLTLAAILLSNVAAVSATSLVLESVLYGLIAGVVTTLLTVIFGEILPQAIFSRRALSYMSKLSPVIRLMIIVTYPVSKPLQLLLDRLFDDPPANHLHTRHELGILISEHSGQQESELDDDEVEIIRGALQLSEKKVGDIMTPINNVYWLEPETKLTPAKIDEIKAIGRSRLPVFNAKLTRCDGVLLMKDLVDVDFDENDYKVDDLPLYPVQMVGSRTALDTMLRKFIATSSHLIPIERDDEVVGIVTIEDLIEEIVGREIEDETDKRQLHAVGND